MLGYRNTGDEGRKEYVQSEDTRQQMALSMTSPISDLPRERCVDKPSWWRIRIPLVSQEPQLLNSRMRGDQQITQDVSKVFEHKSDAANDSMM